MKPVDQQTRQELEQEVLRLRALTYDPERTAFITVTVVGHDVAVAVYGAGVAYAAALDILERGGGDGKANNPSEIEGGGGPNPHHATP